MCFMMTARLFDSDVERDDELVVGDLRNRVLGELLQLPELQPDVIEIRRGDIHRRTSLFKRLRRLGQRPHDFA